MMAWILCLYFTNQLLYTTALSSSNNILNYQKILDIFEGQYKETYLEIPNEFSLINTTSIHTCPSNSININNLICMNNYNTNLISLNKTKCIPNQNAISLVTRWFLKAEAILLKPSLWIHIFQLDHSKLVNNLLLNDTIPHNNVYHIPDPILHKHWMKYLETAIDKQHSITKSKEITSKPMLDKIFYFKEAYYDRKIILIKDGIVDQYGLITSSNDCISIRNGACTPSIQPFQYTRYIKSYPLVITIATSWIGTWHFPMEDLVGLALIDEDILKIAYIHIPHRSTYFDKWLKEIGISTKQIVTGTLAAKILLVPQLAMCGKPYVSQLLWLRNKILNPIQRSSNNNNNNNNNSSNNNSNNDNIYQNSTFANISNDNDQNYTNAITNHNNNLNINYYPNQQSNSHNTIPTKNTIILIERSITREILHKELNILKKTVGNFANNYNLQLKIHNSMSERYSIKDQIKPFIKASIVIAEHGAGLMFINYLPLTSCVIEIASARDPVCYARIAYLYHFHYIMLHFDKNELTNNHGINALNSALKQCTDLLKIQNTSNIDNLIHSTITFPTIIQNKPMNKNNLKENQNLFSTAMSKLYDQFKFNKG